MALKLRRPSDTALAMVFLSAHTPRLLHAFSTLQPEETIDHIYCHAQRFSLGFKGLKTKAKQTELKTSPLFPLKILYDWSIDGLVDLKIPSILLQINVSLGQGDYLVSIVFP